MSAIFSECGEHRFRLEREIQEKGKVFAYFGINPSLATSDFDDQTVKKWKGFSLRNEGSKFIVGNVFSYITPNVFELAQIQNPVTSLNEQHIEQIIKEADILIPCWGSRDKIPSSLHFYLDQLLLKLKQSNKPVLCFGLTASGDPKHVLTLSYKTPLVPI
ncbi:DUF1643 domain-containing protein [Acinetobacter kookii]|uniref:DUF1643 domain-containing protein n=1 Tax=Acinetobacter kookii TaxID=1226327 RepID=A0A1G6H5K4_9GAMM|nr:DUF1643 domain-containing protein [Acinetobacter kookii]SDB89570.1 hypothetical protein SAMN05421732_101727 [Acinetobacter kookii]